MNKLTKLQKLHNRSMRITLKDLRTTPISTRLTTLGWFNVSNCLYVAAIVFWNKFNNSLLPEHFDEFILNNNEVHNYSISTN